MWRGHCVIARAGTSLARIDKNINFKVCGSAWWKVEAFPHAQMDYSRRAHLPLCMLPLDMPPSQGSRRGLITDSCPENCNRSRSKGNFFPLLIRIYPLTRCSRPSLAEFRAACNHLETLCFGEWRLRGSDSPHLERLKPARPEWDASSISGVTMRSIMSVSTVKVGTTMKSMNPGDTDMGGTSSRCVMSDCLTAAAPNSDNSDLYLVPLVWNVGSWL